LLFHYPGLQSDAKKLKQLFSYNKFYFKIYKFGSSNTARLNNTQYGPFHHPHSSPFPRYRLGRMESRTKRINGRLIDWLKYAIFIPWLGLGFGLAIKAGGIHSVNPFFMTDAGVSVGSPGGLLHSATGDLGGISFRQFGSPI
jgi:hypothetical protein